MTHEHKNLSKIRLSVENIKKLNTRGAAYWLKDAAIDWTVMAAAIALFSVTNNPFIFVLSVFIVGNRQHALGLLGHDGTHYTLSYNRNLNDFLTNLFAWWPIGLTMSGYRNLHNMHHKYVGTPNDPEVIYKHIKAEQWSLPSKPLDVLKLAAKDMIGFGADDYFTILKYAKPVSNRALIPLAFLHITFISASILAGFWQIPLVWYTSMLTAFPMFFRLRLWLEHQGTDYVQRLHLNKVEGAILAPHLAWYHWEHHACPTVPYIKLPEVRALLDDEPVINLRQLIQSFINSPEIVAGAVYAQGISSNPIMELEQDDSVVRSAA